MPVGIESVARFGVCYTSTAFTVPTAPAVGIGTLNYAPQSGKANGMVARQAIIHLEGGDVRYHLCGTPAADVGMLFTNGSYLNLNSPGDIQNFKAIYTTPGSVATAVVFLFF